MNEKTTYKSVKKKPKPDDSSFFRREGERRELKLPWERVYAGFHRRKNPQSTKKQ
jgi:hypothetical protein